MHAFTHLDQTRHGTPAFPAEYYYVDSRHPRYQMPFHWHNEWEILRVLSGSFQIHLDGEEYCASAGDILLIRGGTLHGGIPCRCVYECFVFDLYGLFRSMELVKGYLRPFYRQTWVPRCFFPAGEESPVHRITDTLMASVSGGKSPELDTVGCLCGLFSHILKAGLYSSNPGSDDTELHRIDQIKAVLEYIEANYGAPLSLERLAAVVGMNPKYFCRVFHRLTHQSPMDYVNFYRIEQASFLLSSTQTPITAVGMECGFWESSYFTKVFKKYKGVTPRRYRQQQAG